MVLSVKEHKYMIIDDQMVDIEGEANVLAVIRKAGIDLPTFCYNSDLSVYGACRMCVVEDEKGHIIASCSTPPKHGMRIRTNTPQLLKHRRMILELLLSSHCRDCTTCEKSGRCQLQNLAKRFGIHRVRFENYRKPLEVDRSSLAIVHDPSKCILCGDCVRMCSEIQNVGAIDFTFRGANTVVSPEFGLPLNQTSCVSCGQCSAVCPTGALVVRNDTDRIWNVLLNPRYRVVVQVAPAVRVALGEEFAIEPGRSVMGLITAALRRLGFDEIYDTSMGADLTVMEEAAEFLQRLDQGGPLPLFTSCCPAWINYVETRHPELLEHISSCRSPQQMFGSVVKEIIRQRGEPDPDCKTVVVAIMPCTAKKYEAAREEFKTDGIPDVDYVITTQELAYMIKEAGIVFSELEPEGLDTPFGISSGAGKIFGVTGGVTEAVIRRIVADRSPHALNAIAYSGVRGMESAKEAELNLEGRTLRIAVVSGLGAAETVIRRIQSGEAQYDLVEVMACPGGCIGGAGQPFSLRAGKERRAKGLYTVDKMSEMKMSQENSIVTGLYDTFLKEKTHELLHVHYKD